jgi:peptidoglycan hydrolase CwlO-like protein
VAHQLCVRYREIFGSLIKSMISELDSLSDEKESEILNSVENITTLQNSVLRKQSEASNLQERVELLKEEIESNHRMIRQQHSYIVEIVKKENSKLLYALRKRCVAIDRVYGEDIHLLMTVD